MASIHSNKVEEDGEDKDLGASKQCDESVKVSEQRVVQAPAASGS